MNNTASNGLHLNDYCIFISMTVIFDCSFTTTTASTTKNLPFIPYHNHKNHIIIIFNYISSLIRTDFLNRSVVALPGRTPFIIRDEFRRDSHAAESSMQSLHHFWPSLLLFRKLRQDRALISCDFFSFIYLRFVVILLFLFGFLYGSLYMCVCVFSCGLLFVCEGKNVSYAFWINYYHIYGVLFI